MKNLSLIAIFFILLSCNNKAVFKPILIYKFTDSTYSKISDSIPASNIYEIPEEKTLTGYYKIFEK